MDNKYRDLVLFKVDPKTPVLVLPPNKRKWVYHETSKKLAFTVLQELDNKDFGMDDTYKVVNFNRWLVAVPKESIKLFKEA